MLVAEDDGVPSVANPEFRQQFAHGLREQPVRSRRRDVAMSDRVPLPRLHQSGPSGRLWLHQAA